VLLVEADVHIHLRKEVSDFLWWDGKTAIPIYPHVTNIPGQVVVLIKVK
jgi:hypothetical protein